MFSLSHLVTRFRKWRTKRYWQKRQLENLQVLLRTDAQWLAANPIAAALIDRYTRAASNDWHMQEIEDVSQLRTRLGLAPNYKG